jgi:hypothetical protein
MGGSDNKDLRHNQVLKNCLSVGNRVKGFDQNNNIGSMTLYNCTAFDNGTNYRIDGTILASGKALTVTNCISAGSGGVSLTGGIITTCSWSAGFSVSDADFLSVDPAAMIGPRKADGSLPDITFMHLKTGSKLIDAGTIISGMLYNGPKPDLGCFETGPSTDVLFSSIGRRHSSFEIVPFTSGGLFKVVSAAGRSGLRKVNISLFAITGEKIVVPDGLTFIAGSDGSFLDLRSLGAGTYVCELNDGAATAFQRVVRK